MKKSKPQPKPKRPRAPKGGMTFQGKFYRGGQFLPAAAAEHLAERLLPYEKAAAKERQREHGKTAPGKGSNTSGNLPEVLPSCSAQQSKERVAKAVGWSRRTLDDDALILIALSELPTSTQAAMSLHRMMSGRATQRDQTILRVRELQAIESLRERSTTDGEWIRWNDRYIQMASGVM